MSCVVKSFMCLVFLNAIITETNQSSCNCVFLKECTPYISQLQKSEKPLSPQTVQFLRGKQCGFQNGQPKVCCSEKLKDSQANQIKNSCKIQSNCTVLKNCAPYMNLIASMDKPLKKSVVEFLRSQECGFQQGYPKVCCSLLPKSIKALKHSRHGSRRKNINKLMVEEQALNDQAPLRTTTFKPKQISSTRATKTDFKKMQEKAEAINDAFFDAGGFDLTGPFDLMLRKKRFGDSFLEIEIR